MSQIDLKALEKKAWRSFFDDGLWDIYLGTLLGLMGASRWLDRSGLSENWTMGIYTGLMLLTMLLFMAGKRFLTVPRIGQVKFGRERKIRRLKTVLALFASVVVGLVVMLVASAARREASSNIPWQVIVPSIWAVNMLLVFGAMGYFLDFERLYFIGLMYAIALPIDAFILAQFNLKVGAWLFLFLGAVVVVIGVFYLIRFLQKYPRISLNEKV